MNLKYQVSSIQVTNSFRRKPDHQSEELDLGSRENRDQKPKAWLYLLLTQSSFGIINEAASVQ
jgi:hypothetical protein